MAIINLNLSKMEWGKRMKNLPELYFSNLNAACSAGGRFFCPPDFSWRSEVLSFEQNKFYLLTDGECSITIQDKEYTVHAGQWFFIPSRVPHSYHSFKGRSFEKYWMHFDLYPSVNLANMLSLPTFVHVPDGSAVYDLFAQAAKYIKSNRITDRIHLKSCLLSLVAEYIDLACPDGTVVKKTDNRIEQVLRYINSNLDQPLSTAELSKRFHLHPTYFIRFFKDKTGQTPTNYIRIQRLETAKTLLETTNLYVSSIMEQVGFRDESQFSKQFKKYYAHSPRNYRNYFQTHSPK